MNQSIVHIALVVDDYDEAITFYTEKLDFTLLDDTPQSETKRSRIGNQTGGRVFLFLKTDDFWADYEKIKGRGVNFVREPKTEEYGTVAVFEDLYGNRWDLIEFSE